MFRLCSMWLCRTTSIDAEIPDEGPEPAEFWRPNRFRGFEILRRAMMATRKQDAICLLEHLHCTMLRATGIFPFDTADIRDTHFVSHLHSRF